jgi:K+ transporter
MGIVGPAAASVEVARRDPPLWGFGVVLGFNVAIAATTVAALALLGREPFLPSWLTFLPTESYYRAEVVFLPALRVVAWLLGSAAMHLTLRLIGQPSDFDVLLNLGGLVTLVVVPYTLIVDGVLIALDAYGLGLVATAHGAVALVWSVALYTVGLKTVLRMGALPALIAAIAGEAASLPLLAIFAR